MEFIFITQTLDMSKWMKEINYKNGLLGAKENADKSERLTNDEIWVIEQTNKKNIFKDTKKPT
jgi:hypothetical protein